MIDCNDNETISIGIVGADTFAIFHSYSIMVLDSEGESLHVKSGVCAVSVEPFGGKNKIGIQRIS